MKASSLITAAVLCALGGAAMAQSSAQPTQRTPDQSGAMDRSDHNNMSSSDKGGKLTSESFAKKASAAGNAEIAMGKLGVQKATNPAVKKYAQQMVDDHTKGNQELAAAAKGKAAEELKSSPDLMHKAMAEKFEHQKAGPEFDQDFIAQMVKDHQKVIELYQQAATDPSVDPQLQAVAKKTLPKLQAHLREAESMQKTLTAND